MTSEHARRIPLSQGLEAIVDAEDYEWLSKWKWSARKWRARGHAEGNEYAYASRQAERGVWVYMHRIITGAPKGVLVDHINHNGLDNRRANLRICSTSQNSKNIGQAPWGTSGYWGVVKKKRYRGWTSLIRVEGKMVTIGTFATPEAAARAYDEAARKYHGEFAKQNFPEGAER